MIRPMLVLLDGSILDMKKRQVQSEIDAAVAENLQFKLKLNSQSKAQRPEHYQEAER